jgi:hypothetical protein
MSRLDLAEKRLTEALGALEQAAAKAPRGGKAGPAVEALAQERDRLLARIVQLEEDLVALGSASQDIEGRLDGAIGEIRAALAR